MYCMYAHTQFTPQISMTLFLFIFFFLCLSAKSRLICEPAGLKTFCNYYTYNSIIFGTQYKVYKIFILLLSETSITPLYNS